MKKIMLTAALLVAFISSGLAQQGTGSKKDKKTPEERANNLTELYEKKLNLSASQKVKIYTINLERINKMQELRSEGSGTREKREVLIADTEKQIEAVLNDDQRKIYAEMREKAKEGRERRPRASADH